jgi:transposase
MHVVLVFRKNRGFTLLFEAYSMLLIENKIPVSKASKIIGVNSQRISNAYSNVTIVI